MKEKLNNLKKKLSEMESVLLAYSGGVDSTFLLKVAHGVLGDKIMAVIAESPTYPESEKKEALRIVSQMGIKCFSVYTNELSNSNFTNNSLDRCYWCKKELFTKLLKLVEENNLRFVLDGSNYDDIKDYRPGSKAAVELGIRSPLQEVGLTKEEIRILSKELGLDTWNKPSFACLSSRFPFGTTITERNLNMVGKAEEFMRSLDIRQVRVRHHGDIARIEVAKEEIDKILKKDLMERIINKLKGLGYRYVTIDLEGYRTGSLNPAPFSDNQKNSISY